MAPLHVLKTFSEDPVGSAKQVAHAIEKALHIEKHRPMSGLDAKNGRTPPPAPTGDHHEPAPATPAPTGDHHEPAPATPAPTGDHHEPVPAEPAKPPEAPGAPTGDHHEPVPAAPAPAPTGDAPAPPAA